MEVRKKEENSSLCRLKKRVQVYIHTVFRAELEPYW